MNRRPNFEIDEDAFPADAYRISGDRFGIAWRVFGWETEPDEDSPWSGYENRTGRVVCVMVDDDQRFTFDPEEIIPLEREEYCGSCGQIGCTHDGYYRSEEE